MLWEEELKVNLRKVNLSLDIPGGPVVRASLVAQLVKDKPAV